MTSIRLALAVLTAFVSCNASLAAEPSSIPKKFSAVIGGFLGPSYAVEFREGALHYTERKRGADPKAAVTSIITPTEAQWREFRKSLDQINIWRWHPNYTNIAIMDGTQWRFEVEYPDRKLKSEGRNDYPDETGASKTDTGGSTTKSFDRFLDATEKLLGGKSFK